MIRNVDAVVSTNMEQLHKDVQTHVHCDDVAIRCTSQVDWPSASSPPLVATVKDEQSHEGVTGEREGLCSPVASRVGGSCSRLC